MSEIGGSSVGPVTRILTEVKSVIILVLLLGSLLYVGYAIAAWKAKSKYELLLGERTALIEELKITNNTTKSLDKTLAGKDKETQELKQIIKSLEEREPEIKYIVKTKTVIKSKEPEKVFIKAKCDLPESYSYILDNGLKVAEFSAEDIDNKRKYKHKTADITLESLIVITEKKTGVILKAQSSLEPKKKVLLKIDNVKVTHIREFAFFEPHLQIGFIASLDTSPLRSDLSTYISLPLLHILDKQLDIIAPKISANKEHVRVGIDLASYNIGYDLPVLTDLWIAIGTSIPITDGKLSPSIDISIGSKF